MTSTLDNFDIVIKAPTESGAHSKKSSEKDQHEQSYQPVTEM